jgi:hypothetical protein
MQRRIKILFHIYMKLNMFRANTAHHQEPKTALAASGFAYVEGCWTCSCWTLSASSNYTSNKLSIQLFHSNLADDVHILIRSL